MSALEQKQSENFVWGTGRRKCAIARVRVKSGSGQITVNKKPIEQYFVTESMRGEMLAPLKTVAKEDSIDVIISVNGGGLQGQAAAASLGISRALQKMDETLRPPLKKAGLLTRDSRIRERKKPGRPGARKRFQFSKR